MNAPEMPGTQIGTQTGTQTGKGIGGKAGDRSAKKTGKAKKASGTNLKAKKRRGAKSRSADLRAGSAQSAAPLIVWSADPDAGAPLIRLLQKTRALQESGTLPQPGAVGTGAQDPSRVPEMLLLCYSSAQTLCRQMARGTPPGEALELWRTQAEQVLAVNRRNRRRVHIVDLDQALRDPVAALARFGLPESDLPGSDLPGSDPGPDASGAAQDVSEEVSEEVPAPSDPVLLLLAQRCLSGNLAARALAGEMEAATQATTQAGDPAGDPAGDDPDAAFRAWREAGWAREEAGLLQVQTRMMLEEIDLVQQQNRAAQDEVAALSQARMQQEQQSEQRLAQMSQGIESYQAQLEELQAAKVRLSHRLADKESAMDAAGAGLRDLEAQLGDLTSALAGTRQLADTRLREIDALRARVQRFETSHSYRLTAPLRALRGLISGRDQGQDQDQGRNRGKEGGQG